MLTETFMANGKMYARGVGVTIHPQCEPDGYVVRTCKPGGSKHGARYYFYSTYEQALERARQWSNVTLPRRA